MFVTKHLKRPTQERLRGIITLLFGLAPDGVCNALIVASMAVRSYRALSPLPDNKVIGGLLSAALVVGSRRPDVIWHPALWSPDFPPLSYESGECLANSAAQST